MLAPLGDNGSVKWLARAGQAPITSLMALALCYGAALAATVSTDAGRVWYFNADAVYLPTLFRDLFVDHYSLRGWVLSAAPFVFPDGLAYFAIQSVAPSVPIAMYVFGFLQLMTIGIACWWIARGVDGDAGRFAGGLAAILLGVITMALGGAWSSQPQWQIPMLRHLLLPVHHIGSFLVTLVGIAWTVRAMRGRLRILETSCAGVCLIAAVASDRLVIPEFILPATVVWGLSGNWRRAWRAIVLLAGAAVAGAALVQHFETLPEQALATLASTGAIHASASQLLRDVMGLKGASSALSMACLAGIVVAAIELARTWTGRALVRDSRWIPALFVVVMPLSVVCAVLAKGLYFNATTLHYFMGAWLLPVLMLPILLVPRSGARLARAASTEALLGLTLVVLAASTARPDARRLQTDVTLPLARCLDALVDEYHIQFGMSEYWRSKPLTLFSRRDVRVYQVAPDLEPYHWLSNRYWHRGEPGSRFPDPSYTFLVTDTLDTTAVLARFGEPAAKVSCTGGDVWIYNRDTDSAFHRLYR